MARMMTREVLLVIIVILVGLTVGLFLASIGPPGLTTGVYP